MVYIMSSETGLSFEAVFEKLTDPSLGFVNFTPDAEIFATEAMSVERARNLATSLLIITGPSGAGKDTLVAEILRADSRFVRVATATTRDIRPSEQSDAYVWMRQPYESESESEYVANLIKEYELLEHDTHHGNLYGLPMASIQGIPEGKTGVINTDISGIMTLRRVMPDVGLKSVFVCPESRHMLVRNMGEDRDNQVGRLAVAYSYLDRAHEHADYILINRLADDASQFMAKAANRVLSIVFNADNN